MKVVILKENKEKPALNHGKGRRVSRCMLFKTLEFLHLHSLICSFTRSFTHPSIHSFTHASIHLFAHSFIHSLIHSISSGD